jgi:hypothetical protein
MAQAVKLLASNPIAQGDPTAKRGVMTKRLQRQIGVTYGKRTRGEKDRNSRGGFF